MCTAPVTRVFILFFSCTTIVASTYDNSDGGETRKPRLLQPEILPVVYLTQGPSSSSYSSCSLPPYPSHSLSLSISFSLSLSLSCSLSSWPGLHYVVRTECAT